jgi:hypothetical protein
MKSTAFYVSIIVFAAVFVSCKKSKNESTPVIEGKWKVVSHGYDVNNNSVMDASETTAFPDSMVNYTLFSHDGSGVVIDVHSGVSDTQTWFTWVLANSNANITITRTKGNPAFVSLSGTDTYRLDSVSSTVLRLTIIASGSNLNWQTYKKQ